jgi:beta-glucanase (GH16 family)
MLARRTVLRSAVPLTFFALLGVELPARAAPPPDSTITFTGAAGSPPDKAVWLHETGGNGWGNDEVQTYTTDAANAHVDGAGRLVITARREARTGADGIARDYTSARLTTQGRLSVTPGSYVEATITAPTGTGLWPAFWLAGDDLPQVGWPAAGELDVFEGWGADPTVAHSAVHMATKGDPDEDHEYGWDQPGGTTDLGTSLARTAHRYGVYFDSQTARFYIDGKTTMTVSAKDATAAGAVWPFGRPQHLLLNLAVAGGEQPTADFPQSMIVSDVKIWKEGVPF